MKIAVAGGTGFIGSRLIRYLESCGDEVILISRSSTGGIRGSLRTVAWDECIERKEWFESLDGIVNLTGESINQRWTEQAKRRIVESRLDTVAKLARLVGQLKDKPKAFVNGSAIGIYGTSETDVYDESSPVRAVDFLSGVVEQWERAASAVPAPRLILLRTGVVLGHEGGALPLMSLPYKLGAGGRVGSGRQWLSWIHADDIVRLIPCHGFAQTALAASACLRLEACTGGNGRHAADRSTSHAESGNGAWIRIPLSDSGRGSEGYIQTAPLNIKDFFCCLTCCVTYR
ncbi:MAG: hypothetical protein K0R28_5804 [Paenibacillus sp.]|nr:hypothetical protein [Paenibacillus sp.]